MRISLLLASILLIGACNDPDGPTYPGGGGGDDGTGTGSGSGGSTSPAAPKILSIATNVKTLHESDQLIVTAVVTDPNGIDDVIGGQLSTTDGGASYGSFATEASEGAYSISLTWNAIDVADSIDTDVGMALPRQFRATFFDAEGNSTYRDVGISLQCHDATDAACSGTCTDMSVESTQHCGSCDHACAKANYPEQCSLEGGGICFVRATVSQRLACNSICGGPYPICYDAYVAYEGGGHVTIDCSKVPDATVNSGNFYSVDCTCGDR
jgi:hypothetical protein